MHADIANLEFLGKSAMTPNYALSMVDFFSSEVDAHPVRSRKQLLKYLKEFYDKVKTKMKNNRMRLQSKNEFQQVKIKDLNA